MAAEEEISPEAVDLYIRQTLPDIWKESEDLPGSEEGRVGYVNRKTGDYFWVDHEDKEMEGHLRGGMDAGGPELNTVASTLDTEYDYEVELYDDEAEKR